MFLIFKRVGEIGRILCNDEAIGLSKVTLLLWQDKVKNGFEDNLFFFFVEYI